MIKGFISLALWGSTCLLSRLCGITHEYPIKDGRAQSKGFSFYPLSSFVLLLDGDLAYNLLIRKGVELKWAWP